MATGIKTRDLCVFFGLNGLWSIVNSKKRRSIIRSGKEISKTYNTPHLKKLSVPNQSFLRIYKR